VAEQRPFGDLQRAIFEATTHMDRFEEIMRPLIGVEFVSIDPDGAICKEVHVVKEVRDVTIIMDHFVSCTKPCEFITIHFGRAEAEENRPDPIIGPSLDFYRDIPFKE